MRTSTNPTGPKVNGRVKPPVALRGLELGTIGLHMAVSFFNEPITVFAFILFVFLLNLKGQDAKSN